MSQQSLLPSCFERKLSQQEIIEISAIAGINEKKNNIQDKFLNTSIRNKFSLILAPTGFGKTTMGIKYIQRLRKVTEEKVIIIVPTTDLFNNWTTKLRGISNIEVYVVNSYVFNPKDYECHTLIVDEVHRFTNRESEHFSTVFDITRRKFTLCFSATMEWHHLDFLKEKGLKVICNLETKLARRFGIVPKAEIINVPVEFTKREKLFYNSIQKNIEEVCSMFMPLGLENKVYSLLGSIMSNRSIAYHTAEELFPDSTAQELAKMSGVIIGKASQFMKLIRERKVLLNNAENKYKAVEKILDLEKKSSFIFMSNIDSIENIKRNDIVPYHSKIPKKKRDENMKRFLTEDVHLVSIKSVTTGLDLETKCQELGVPPKDVDLVVNVGYNSSKVESTQKSGRANRIDLTNENKIAKTYNIYVDDYVFDNKLVISQEKIWLKRSQANLDRVILLEI